uniref:Uncharacterized protein n=1 Tax=Pithovirus LCPAC101 TaxID=2506586 RepID=A0A481Z220_9VIRU|nr:MAG: hypothetical protein LCPAC101_00290 [Pithovirus LCPAC101]
MDKFIAFAKTSSDKPLTEEYLNISSIYKRYFECKGQIESFAVSMGKHRGLLTNGGEPTDIMSMGMLSITMGLDVCADISLLCFEIARITKQYIPNNKYAFIPGMSILLMALIDKGYMHEAILLLSAAGGSGVIEKYIDESWSPLNAVCTVGGPLNIVRKDAQKMRDLARMTKEKEDEQEKNKVLTESELYMLKIIDGIKNKEK